MACAVCRDRINGNVTVAPATRRAATDQRGAQSHADRAFHVRDWGLLREGVYNEIYTAKPPLFSWLIVVASAPRGVIDRFIRRIMTVISLGLQAVVMLAGMRQRLSTKGLVFLGFSLA